VTGGVFDILMFILFTLPLPAGGVGLLHEQGEE